MNQNSDEILADFHIKFPYKVNITAEGLKKFMSLHFLPPGTVDTLVKGNF